MSVVIPFPAHRALSDRELDLALRDAASPRDRCPICGGAFIGSNLDAAFCENGHVDPPEGAA